MIMDFGKIQKLTPSLSAYDLECTHCKHKWA